MGNMSILMALGTGGEGEGETRELGEVVGGGEVAETRKEELSSLPLTSTANGMYTCYGFTIDCTRKWIGNAVQNISSSSVRSRDKIVRAVRACII